MQAPSSSEIKGRVAIVLVIAVLITGGCARANPVSDGGSRKPVLESALAQRVDIFLRQAADPFGGLAPSAPFAARDACNDWCRVWMVHLAYAARNTISLDSGLRKLRPWRGTRCLPGREGRYRNYLEFRRAEPQPFGEP